MALLAALLGALGPPAGGGVVRVAVVGAHSPLGRAAVVDAVFRGWSTVAVAPEAEHKVFDALAGPICCLGLHDLCELTSLDFTYILFEPSAVNQNGMDRVAGAFPKVASHCIYRFEDALAVADAVPAPASAASRRGERGRAFGQR